ncbi:Beige protein-like protein 1 [Colletotrichum orbiculare MAFF 240422]|uniref:Beige protein homolog 1 n=1 Tax=Colletotrichum orbiculare (strain 104-T / ATCC 96160 / CBS 514.97 / LARS 414 / MAFF 240422) TaxID=1213857 RepID=A0A484FTQ6_COLOR|nr:Beige protein-like protein 1 [Colletotrichum orbiculare MAFF 240422]
MSTLQVSRRYRSSTSASSGAAVSKATEILRGLLEGLANGLRQRRAADAYPEFPVLLKSLRQIRQHIAATEPPSPPQDDFRHLRGFTQILDVLRSFSGFYNPQRRTEEEKQGLFGLLEAVLDVFAAVFLDHPGNKRYFRHRVEGGGWEALEQTIASVGLGGSDSDLWANCQVFGKLLSFSLGDKKVDALCQSIASQDTVTDAKPKIENASSEDAEKASMKTSPMAKDLGREVRDVVQTKTIFRNPEILRAVVGFWESIPRAEDTPANPCSMVVLEIMSTAVSISLFNLAALHATGVLSRFLRVLFDPVPKLDQTEKDKLLILCKKLMYLGVNQPSDTQFLLANPLPEASEFCLEMTSTYSGPPFFQFDLSLHGHSSIELPTLGRVFPPQSSPGYTFTAWIRVDRFDPAAHTTVFGVFDATQTCFLLMYLERDTHNFILQTSVTSSRPSVRFKGMSFKDKQWYHIALVHRRPKTMTASKASLYVNGEFVEQIKCAYPTSPPFMNGSTDSFASFATTVTKPHPVQAFLGTPRDLSSQLGAGLVFSKWSLASAHLFEDVLSDDFLAVHYGLSPKYQGNFQDSLGGFQTYEASASLGLRNEVFHPGRDESSDIIRAIRDKAGSLLPENKVLLSIVPAGVFREDGVYQDTQLYRALPRNAATNLIQMTHRSGSAIAINVALPCLLDALARSHGVAVLTGNPVVAIPSYFDDNFWRLAGYTPLALKLVERASNVEETVRAVEMTFLCIRKSWRNSEAMERDNGYAILGMLLRAKLGYTVNLGADNANLRLPITSEERDRLSFRLLSLVLDFVGYKHADPLESFIVNPLAYRILLIDFDTWRKSAPITQELYYKQFVTFSVKSKYHQFNSRRLMRMRIVKRLLDAMKAEPISEEVLPHFMSALEHLVKCNYTAEVHRALALFITYAYHSPTASLVRTPRPVSAVARSPTPGSARRATFDSNSSTNTSPASRFLTKKQLGAKILGMYTILLCEKGNRGNISKFARTVTNKWLLYLLASDDPDTVVNGSKILARLLITHGSAYTAKFSGKTGGFAIMAHRLKRWWYIPSLWPICFCIMFGYDVAEIDLERNLDLSSLLDKFSKSRIIYQEVLQVLTSMLQHGLKDIMKHQEDPNSPQKPQSLASGFEGLESRPRAKSMETRGLESTNRDGEGVANYASILHGVIRLMSDLHSRSPDFRDFALTSEYVRYLLWACYPIIVSTDAVSPETELNSRDSALTFDGGDVMIRPLAGSQPGPIVRTTSTDAVASLAGNTRGTPLRKASGFVLLTNQKSPPSSARFAPVMSPRMKVASQQSSSVTVDSLLDLVVSVFIDQAFTRKEFPGFSLYLKVPPGFQEHQAYFESYVLRNTLQRLGSYIQSNLTVLCEPKVLTNMGRLTSHVTESIFEGWFINGTEPMLEFAGLVLEYLQRPKIASLKSVRLCSQAVATIRQSFLKLLLLRFSELDDPDTPESGAKDFMSNILYWQAPILSCLSSEEEYMKLFWYQLYTKLVDSRVAIRSTAATIMRIMLVQKPDEAKLLFRQCVPVEQQHLTKDFAVKLTEVDDEAFIEWVDQHRASLDSFFFGGISKAWEEFVVVENQRTIDSAKFRLARRKDRLKAWQTESLTLDNILLRHDMANGAWMKSIFNSEHFKHQRATQDQQDDMAFLAASFRKMDLDLHRPGAVFAEQTQLKWKLDRTEGRNRMRLRLLPDYSKKQVDYQPKRRAGEALSTPSSLKVNTDMAPAEISPSPIKSATPASSRQNLGLEGGNFSPDTPPDGEQEGDVSESGVGAEEDFELVEDPNDPNEGDDGFEDKNRKVMRQLQQGDQVQAVYNISRIVGLEACEGILIVGKEALYIMDNVFQCASGEIVNAWQAPPEERDPFSEIITDAKTTEQRQSSSRSEQESRSWRWHDVISISKRRFLFRDVAVEIFFTDGRSYLLTSINPLVRDDVFGKLMSKAPHTNAASSLPNPEDAWRLDALKVSEEVPQGFGSKFGSIFNSSPWNPAMKKWQKGEMSNFHYLMLVNTMAGRTFNDLTQYPVFPWVLADYTSEELNLNDPASFRDLTKPMGAQTSGRVAGFRESYEALAEIGETPFHYGTHYSSAMIVSSYLIRLPPFVQSYILLQGGSFDHADRLFQSIPHAWQSASCDNKADVRELIPEFFCLPEFLTNINQYNFGNRESTGAKVNNVVLPPWAKGDPKIFITKHREALESPYVSQHLHSWIDLVFGFKQRGEAAVDNLNVFHHLSYRGATDLDNISDPQERRILAGVIHNFGQTPHQVFPRPHPAREYASCPIRRLDTSVYALTRINHPLLESHERVASLVYSPKIDRLICASPFRLNVAPYDKFLEWGYADNSVRFFFSDNRKPAGLFENLHIGQLSCAMFADSKTLITAGEDCVVSVYAVQTSPGRVTDLLPRSSLFGHRAPVTAIAVSKSFSTFVTVSTDGQAFLWDLNRLEFIRKLPLSRPVECARINDVSGEIMLGSGPNVVLYNINGTVILDQNVCAEPEDYVHACAFYEGAGNEWLENYLIFTGHKRGRVNVWKKCVKNGKWALELLRRLDHVDMRSEVGANYDAGITCITPMPQCVYTGDDDGRVYEWNLVQRDR